MSYFVAFTLSLTIVGLVFVAQFYLMQRWITKLKMIKDGDYDPDEQVLYSLVDILEIMNDKVVGVEKDK